MNLHRRAALVLSLALALQPVSPDSRAGADPMPPAPAAAAPDSSAPAGSALAIVAADPDSGEVGAAVIAASPAAVADAGWASAGAGAVAVLGRPDRAAAWRALDFLSQGVAPREALEALLAQTPEADALQVALVDPAAAAPAARSGNVLPVWRGQLVGRTYACLGNGISGEKTVLAMGVAFETARGDLADRLLAALQSTLLSEAGRRAYRSASLRVVIPLSPPIDLRVDDHEEPVRELQRLLGLLDAGFLHRLGSRPIGQTRGPDVRRVQEMLRSLGFFSGGASGVLDDASVEAVRAFRRGAGLPDASMLDAAALEALQTRYRDWKRRQPAAPAAAPESGSVESEILPDPPPPPPQATPSTPPAGPPATPPTPAKPQRP